MPEFWRQGWGRQRFCNLGNAFYSQTQSDKAIEFFTKHLDISRELGDRAEEGRAVSNLGRAFS